MLPCPLRGRSASMRRSRQPRRTALNCHQTPVGTLDDQPHPVQERCLIMRYEGQKWRRVMNLVELRENPFYRIVSDQAGCSKQHAKATVEEDRAPLAIRSQIDGFAVWTHYRSSSGGCGCC